MSILYYIKFEFSLEYKVIFNYTILYLMILIMIDFEFLKNLKNN